MERDYTVEKKKTTPYDIVKKKGKEKIAMVTAYDYVGAELAEKAGVDMILVGDSAGMVVFGYESTIPVSMDEMIMISQAARRGASKSLIVGDMPFLSYNVSVEDAVRNAGRFVKEGGMDAVKLEGGEEYEATIKAIRKAGIPVMGHIGLLPQSVPLWSGYKVQGTTADSAQRLLEHARALEQAGAFAIVLEMVTVEAAQLVTENIGIPTIGIGAGIHCDGQVLVYHDLLGLYNRVKPRFAKRYLDLSTLVLGALESYRNDVVTATFPTDAHSYHMSEEEARKLGKQGGT